MTSTPATKRSRPGGRSARVVTAVHAATLELLDEVGFDGLQLPAVAERAQVNRTTVYRRWPTRIDLLADLLTTFTDDHVADPDTGSFEGDLRALLAAIAAALQSRAIRSILRGATEAAESEPEMRAAQDAFWERRFQLSCLIVERAVSRGELPAGVDSRSVLEMASGPLYFRALFTAEAVDDRFIEEVTRRVVTAFASR